MDRVEDELVGWGYIWSWPLVLIVVFLAQLFLFLLPTEGYILAVMCVGGSLFLAHVLLVVAGACSHRTRPDRNWKLNLVLLAGSLLAAVGAALILSAGFHKALFEAAPAAYRPFCRFLQTQLLTGKFAVFVGCVLLTVAGDWWVLRLGQISYVSVRGRRRVRQSGIEPFVWYLLAPVSFFAAGAFGAWIWSLVDQANYYHGLGDAEVEARCREAGTDDLTGSRAVFWTFLAFHIAALCFFAVYTTCGIPFYRFEMTNYKLYLAIAHVLAVGTLVLNLLSPTFYVGLYLITAALVNLLVAALLDFQRWNLFVGPMNIIINSPI